MNNFSRFCSHLVRPDISIKTFLYPLSVLPKKNFFETPQSDFHCNPGCIKVYEAGYVSDWCGYLK